jgi:flavodoxin/NAD-dependent dihydropyrimidine dehydrogenase PreA subunit
MKRALIVYFSQRGTNGRVAEAISTGLRENGCQVTLWNLRDGPPPSPRDFDLLGIGTPTYYYRPPFTVTDYVKSLPDLSGISAFVSVVHGAYRGNTGNVIRRALRLKGAREVGYFCCFGADYFLGYLKEGCLFSPDHPTAEELGHAEIFGGTIAARLAGARYVTPDDDPQLPVVYRLERFLANRLLVKLIYSRSFRVNRRCRPDCDICIKHCPVENIRRGDNGRLAWGRSCLLCLSCEMNCPEDAITSPVSWPIFRPFMIYNTRRACQDPLLDSARVIHRRGLTTRL